MLKLPIRSLFRVTNLASFVFTGALISNLNSMANIKGRALHFVLRTANRKETVKFLKSVFGMKILRHEEFEEGCEASCNGPFDGKWSKTMIGHGAENDYFVIELTYNYGIKSYTLGNDFVGMVIKSSSAVGNANKNGYTLEREGSMNFVVSPDGYRFYIDDSAARRSDVITKVILTSSFLSRSVDYWHGVLNMKVMELDETHVILGYDDHQCKIELRDISNPIEHEDGYGRIAYSCETSELPNIQAKVRGAGYAILTPLISLDTPGKATVQVVILADPDGHEICFVGDEGFRKLSIVDSKAEKLLDEAMAADWSDTYYAQLNKEKDS